ncbi:Kae1-like domain-containing protein [Tepidimicrobium xylanilyticum]|uniref:N(6)-L-threonylcarbamoyladenine synthase n=1 Tax=Tepidimicrobium xylanilyticum TaxID=1123352 RepID=A0A1H3CTW0_9FIRM|nr:O-sialoglycoprotein endopeptidase [Tepidimicrobium xylanilyticum]SDX56849.1 N6-L-threonylcarbamoyladenine synthase [Tepidimicrobium xylanilyticum]
MDLSEEGMKMENKYFVGIDTSAYTTSLAVIDGDNNIVLNLRKTLKVKEGQRGLRQQEAVFQHINNLPHLIEEMTANIDINGIVTVSCSNKPRNVEGSYMPVFIVGRNQAFILSKILGANFKEYSHQEGHIGAGIMGSSLKCSERFFCLHISGGTTELLLVSNKGNRIYVEIIGGTLDISLGQLIDRIGVKLGFRFPCGQDLDRISQTGRPLNLKVPIKISKGTWFNLSGLENYFSSLIESKNYDLEDIVSTLFSAVTNLIFKVINNAYMEYGLKEILITGGVSANNFIRSHLNENLVDKGIKPYFAQKKMSTDNGVGIAFLGKEGYIVGD